MPICKININTKVIIKDKIVKVSTGADIKIAKKILTKALPNKMKNDNNDINGTNMDKIATVGCLKTEVIIQLMLAVVIVSKKLTKHV